MSENETILLRPNSRTLALKRKRIEIPVNTLFVSDEDGSKEEWQTKHFQNIQISEYDYYDLDRLVDEILYMDGEVLIYE